jgi:guanine deaminase
MRRAIELAVENVRSGRGGPFGAVVVKGDQMIATGVNLVTARNDPSAHAEIVAIRTACQALGDYQLRECEVYTSCEPCPMCLGALYWARPKAYFFASTRQQAAEFGFDDDFIYNQIFYLHQNACYRAAVSYRRQACSRLWSGFNPRARCRIRRRLSGVSQRIRY